jgi:hypothetical protein
MRFAPTGDGRCFGLTIVLGLFILSAGGSIPAAAAVSFEVEDARVFVALDHHDVHGPGAMCTVSGEKVLVTDLAGRSLLCFGPDGGLKWKTDATGTGEQGLLQPRQVAASHETSIFVLDTGLRKILKFDGRGAFTGYVAGEDVRIPSAIALGPGGELYIYDSATWELVCLSPVGSLRWRVKPWKLTGEPSSMRIVDGEIHLLVPDERTIYTYGKFGEFLRKTTIPPGDDRDDGKPTAFWKTGDGYLFVTTDHGLLLVFDQLGNPFARISSLPPIDFERLCDLSVRGNSLYLLDCGAPAIYQMTLK